MTGKLNETDLSEKYRVKDTEGNLHTVKPTLDEVKKVFDELKLKYPDKNLKLKINADGSFKMECKTPEIKEEAYKMLRDMHQKRLLEKKDAEEVAVKQSATAPTNENKSGKNEATTGGVSIQPDTTNTAAVTQQPGSNSPSSGN